jgi:N-acyl homoserine lactone hydrolase
LKRFGKYVIRPVPLLRIDRDKGQWTYRMNHGQKISAIVYVWYIEGSEPKILVDTGCLAEQYTSHGRHAESIQSLDDGLKKYGVKPEDIDIVILTHLHLDHVGLADRFPNAKFIVQKKELDFALNPHPLAEGYQKESFEKLNMEVIDGEKEIIDGVSVFPSPGHTPGGQSVAVATPKGLAIIAGFCSIKDNFEPPAEVLARGIEVIPPGLHFDVIELYNSVLKVKQDADFAISLHDVEFRDKESLP